MRKPFKLYTIIDNNKYYLSYLNLGNKLMLLKDNELPEDILTTSFQEIQYDNEKIIKTPFNNMMGTDKSYKSITMISDPNNKDYKKSSLSLRSVGSSTCTYKLVHHRNYEKPLVVSIDDKNFHLTSHLSRGQKFYKEEFDNDFTIHIIGKNNKLLFKNIQLKVKGYQVQWYYKNKGYVNIQHSNVKVTDDHPRYGPSFNINKLPMFSINDNLIWSVPILKKSHD